MNHYAIHPPHHIHSRTGRKGFRSQPQHHLHKISTAHTGEEAVGGVTSGLIKEGETVTWQAKHLFKTRRFTSRITAMLSPLSFTDEMVQGDFKSLKHEHHFKAVDNGTIMIDQMEFETPYGVLGRWLNRFYLRAYLEKLLLRRNEVIKSYAETEKWKAVLN